MNMSKLQHRSTDRGLKVKAGLKPGHNETAGTRLSRRTFLGRTAAAKEALRPHGKAGRRARALFARRAALSGGGPDGFPRRIARRRGP